jgi:hypothetical protein
VDDVPRKPVTTTPTDASAAVDALIEDDILTAQKEQGNLARVELRSTLMMIHFINFGARLETI